MNAKEKQDTVELIRNLFELHYNHYSDKDKFFAAIEEAIIGKPDAEEVPVLVGHLNKQQGFNHFKPIAVGTPVYEFRGIYFVEQETLDGSRKERVRYPKENLSRIINFLPPNV